MGCGPGPVGERHRPAGALSPGQDGAAARAVEEAGDLGAGHIGHRRGEVDQPAVGPRGAEGDHGVEGDEGVGRQLPGLPGDEQVALGGGVEQAARGRVPPDGPMGFVDDHPLRNAGCGPVGFDCAGQVRRVGSAGGGVEAGQVGDHAGVTVPEEAHDLGGVGEAALVAPGDNHVTQLAEPVMVAFGVAHDQGVAEADQLFADQPGQVGLALPGAAADGDVEL